MSLEDVIDNLKADMQELYNRLGATLACSQITILNMIERNRRMDDANIKHD